MPQEGYAIYKILSTTIVLLSLVMTSAFSGTELDWEHNYDNALATAKRENKTVYLFIGADNCRHCDRFKSQTLSNEELIQTMKKKYVLIYMSRDQHNIPEKFERYGVPMHYFLTSDGKIIAKVQGSRELEGWYDVLDEIDLRKEK